MNRARIVFVVATVVMVFVLGGLVFIDIENGQRISALEANVNGLNTNVNGLNETLNGLATDLNGLNSTVNSLNSAVTSRK